MGALLLTFFSLFTSRENSSAAETAAIQQDGRAFHVQEIFGGFRFSCCGLRPRPEKVFGCGEGFERGIFSSLPRRPRGLHFDFFLYTINIVGAVQRREVFSFPIISARRRNDFYCSI